MKLSADLPRASLRIGLRNPVVSHRRPPAAPAVPSGRENHAREPRVLDRGAGEGSEIQLLSWKASLLLERTSFAQAMISSGCISSTPHDPSPPAFATAIERDGPLAPAMGASRIGTRRPKRAQKASARLVVAVIGSSDSDAGREPH